jgi:hemolysin activation/secretion protein
VTSLHKVAPYIGSVLVALALTSASTGMALAQTDDSSAIDNAASWPTAPPPTQSVAQTLFVQISSPADQDVSVPLETEQLHIAGVALPGAVVSVAGDLVDLDDEGNFSDTIQLDEGANVVDVVASDDEGNQVSTTLFVVRGE